MKKGCLLSLLVGFAIFIAIVVTIGILISDYEKNPPSEKVTTTESTEEKSIIEYNIEDISKGKYYVSNSEYEKLYDKACNAALAWVDIYDEYKPIENSKLTIYDDGSIVIQIYSLDGKSVSVTYSAEDKNGDRERIAIMYDTDDGIQTITEK